MTEDEVISGLKLLRQSDEPYLSGYDLRVLKGAVKLIRRRGELIDLLITGP